MILLYRMSLVTIALASSACTTLQNQSRVDPQTVTIFPDEVRCASFRIPGDTNVGALLIDCIEGGDGDSLYAAAQTSPSARNDLANRLIQQSNRICVVEMGRLTGNEAIVNTIFSTATTGLSTAASIVTGDWAAILAGGATFTNGTRDHFRAEVYRNFVTYQLIKVIAAARANKLQAITSHHGDDTTKYRASDMIREVDEYHQICSFHVGLTLVDQAVSRTAVTSSQRVDDLNAAINELEVRINALDTQLARTGLTDDQKNGISAQREALRTEQTTLFTQRAQVRTGTTPAPASTATTAPPDATPEEG